MKSLDLLLMINLINFLRIQVSIQDWNAIKCPITNKSTKIVHISRCHLGPKVEAEYTERNKAGNYQRLFQARQPQKELHLLALKQIIISSIPEKIN